MRTFTLIVLAALGGLLGCAALAGSGTQPQPQSGAQEMADLRQRLRAMEAAATCNAQSDCRAMPMGARQCGGPSAWLALSATQLDAARPLADRLTALSQADNARRAANGENSTCTVLPEPAVGCVAGYCRIQPGGGAGRAD